MEEREMKRLLVLFALVAALALPAFAEESKDVTVKMNTQVLSDYIFRGKIINRDPVTQSEVGIKKGMFELNLWGDFDVTDENESKNEFSEFRLNFNLSREVYAAPAGKFVKSIVLLGGLTYYSFPESERHATEEIYGGADVKTAVYGIHSKTVLHYDFDEVDGAYISQDFYRKIDIPYSFNIGKQLFKVSATPEVGFGWGAADYVDGVWGIEKEAWTDWHTSLKLLAESDKAFFGPFVEYSDLLDAKVQDRQNESANFTYGIMAGYKF
jgi:hypothetical protein